MPQSLHIQINEILILILWIVTYPLNYKNKILKNKYFQKKCYSKDPIQTRNKHYEVPVINLMRNVKELCKEKHN